MDNSDFISDTSSVSSLSTPTRALTSLVSNVRSPQRNPTFARIHSSTTRPLRTEYVQYLSNEIDYRHLSPVSNTNTISSFSSPISTSAVSSNPKDQPHVSLASSTDLPFADTTESTCAAALPADVAALAKHRRMATSMSPNHRLSTSPRPPPVLRRSSATINELRDRPLP